MEKENIFEMKMINGYQLYDHRDLRNYPLYIRLIKDKWKPFWIDYEQSDALTIIDSLQAFKWFLDKNDWVFQKKYFSNVCKHFQGELNLPPE
jgi:hypothetical protein